MSGIQLQDSIIGQRFFNVSLPKLIKSINRLAGDKLYECEISNSLKRVEALKMPEKERLLITTDFSKVVELFNSYATDTHLYIKEEEYAKAMQCLSERQNLSACFRHVKSSSGEIKEDFWFEFSIKAKEIK